VASLVHPFTATGSLCDDTAAFEAAIPPVVEAVYAHLLIAVLHAVDAIRRQLLPLALVRFPPWDRVLATDEVLVRSRLPLEDVPLEVVPEGGVDDRHCLHLAALPEHRQALLRVVEMADWTPWSSPLRIPTFKSR